MRRLPIRRSALPVAGAELANAIASVTANSSASTNGVATLDTAFTEDPPTLADIGVLRARVNELIHAMRRWVERVLRARFR